MSLAFPLFERLIASPYTPALVWEEGGALGLTDSSGALSLRIVGDGRRPGVLPWRGEPVGATIQLASASDLARMLQGQPPEAQVGFTLGEGVDRLNQARALLVLGALGWAGPWPDPTANPEYLPLYRTAAYDLALGPCDARALLFPSDSGLPRVTLWIREAVEGRWVATEGLAEHGGSEVVMLAPPPATIAAVLPALRLAALYTFDARAPLPPTLDTPRHTLRATPDPRFPRGLPLPTHLAPWARVRA